MSDLNSRNPQGASRLPSYLGVLNTTPRFWGFGMGAEKAYPYERPA